MLFVVGMVLSLPLALLPVNWLVSRGLLRGLPAWMAAVHCAAFVAALLPSLVASRMEQRPVASYGLPLRRAFGARFWEGAAWGLATATLPVIILYASRSISFGAGALNARGMLRFGVVWAVAMLGLGFFEEYAKRGYLQFTLTRSMGFWPAAVLLSSLFGLEKLLSDAWRNIAFASSIIYGLVSCLALQRTGHLWFAVGFNAALGWGMVFLYGLGIPITGRDPAGALLKPLLHGPDWLTGGQNGPYASVLTPALMALLWVGLHFRFPRTTNSAHS